MMKKFLLMLTALLLCVSTASATILPPTGVDEDFMAWTGIECTPAVILCESLSILNARGDQGGKKVGALLYTGRDLAVIESWDGWAKIYYSDGNKTGWVRNDYLLMDPAWYVCDESLQVYAYPDTMAPRVALLDKGTRRVKLHLPYDKGGLLDMLYREAKVESVEYGETIEVTAVCGPKTMGHVEAYVVQ